MAQTAYTKGPWRVANGVNVMAGVSRYVAATTGLEDRTRLDIRAIDTLNDEDAANARLIAAAPQMFEALKMCLTRDPDLRFNVMFMEALAAASGVADPWHLPIVKIATDLAAVRSAHS